MGHEPQSIAVFCGANQGVNPLFTEAAVNFATHLASRNIGLVYGGANVGLMKVIADTMLAKKGRVIGVIPDFLVKKELAHPNLSELHIVKTMHDRKAVMAECADAFALLPGGFGSLDEFFEIITWRQLDIHNKPAGILNCDNYYEHLLSFFEGALNNQFISEANVRGIPVLSQAADLIDTLLPA